MWMWWIAWLACGDDKVSSVDTCPLSHDPLVEVPTGMCVARNLTGWAADADRLESAITDLQRVGATSVRTDVLWHKIQPAEDTWNFEVYDAMLDALEAADIELIAMVAYGTTWASSQTTSESTYPPDDPADFANFAAAVADRYEGRITKYEIWNEPNAGRFWRPELSGDPEAWGELALQAARAIHSEDPAAEVILGGTFFPAQVIMGGEEFIRRAIAAHPDLLMEADTIAVHPYPTYPPQVAPESEENGNTPLVDVVSTMRDLTDGMPVMISEYGWPVWGEVDVEVQAQFLERAALLAASSGVTGICWYTLWDSEDPDNPEDNFGLLDVDGAFKPTADAFVRLADAFDRSEGAALITGLPEGAHGVHLAGVGDVLWGEGEVCGETLGPTPIWR
jgi:hypothetical protein